MTPLAASIAASDSIIAPRTDSSASRFWGGSGAVAAISGPAHRRRGARARGAPPVLPGPSACSELGRRPTCNAVEKHLFAGLENSFCRHDRTYVRRAGGQRVDESDRSE